MAGTEKNELWSAAGAAAAGGGGVTYFGDGSDGTVTFDGTTTDGMSAGASSYGFYFEDGTSTKIYPTPLSSATDKFYEITVANKSGSYDGDMAVKEYSGLTIDADYILTTDQPCRGLMVLVDGDATINGSLSMTCRGANIDPTTGGVAAGGIDIPVKPASGGLSEDLSGGAVFDGCGTAAVALEGNFPNTGTGSLLNIPKLGMPDTTGNDGDSTWRYWNGSDADNYTVTSSWDARPADCGKTGQGGNGVAKFNMGTGGAGSCFSGGPGGPGAYAGGGGPPAQSANNFGGAGKDGYNSGDWGAGGGAGNPGGSAATHSAGVGVDGGDGCGGLIILLISGDLTIGAAGGIYCGGTSGGTLPSSGQVLTGAGSGAGTMIVGYGGTLTNNGTISCTGGFSTVAENSGKTWPDIPHGGDGSVQLINLNA